MILFLDFDGVLHPFDHPDGVFSLLPDFERVVREFGGVDIVISSAWREAFPLDALRTHFSPDIRARIIDITPIFTGMEHPYIREAEILAWLRDAGRDCEPWIAIDDTEWFFSPGCSNLILVDTTIGFNDDIAQQLRQRLRG